MGRKIGRSWFVISGSWFVAMLAVYCLLPVTYAYAETVTSKGLIENAKALDGKIVTYKGEAVTAVLDRGKYSWVNVNDGDNAIGVWCDNGKLGDIRFLGDYKNKGDILEVEGVFNRACASHNGELDIHADKIKVLKSGFEVREDVNLKRLQISLVIFSVALLLGLVFKRRF